jgi:hypothetical protein
MATTEEKRRRMRAMAEQLHSELGSMSVPEDACWLASVEDLAAELGDAFATAMVEKESQAHAEPCQANCPECGKPGNYRGPRERELITRRGPATISEPTFYCPCCRKSFFPADGNDRR